MGAVAVLASAILVGALVFAGVYVSNNTKNLNQTFTQTYNEEDIIRTSDLAPKTPTQSKNSRQSAQYQATSSANSNPNSSNLNTPDTNSQKITINPSTAKKITISDGDKTFVFLLPENWSYEKPKIQGISRINSYYILDETGKIFGIIRCPVPPVGYEGEEIARFTKSTYKTKNLGTLKRFDIVSKDKGGRIIFMSPQPSASVGFYPFQLDVLSGTGLFARSPEEYQTGRGIPYRYKTYKDIVNDFQTIEAILNSAYEQ